MEDIQSILENEYVDMQSIDSQWVPIVCSKNNKIRCRSSNRMKSSVQPPLIIKKKRRGFIEKKRRDKINNSLVELKSLVPTAIEMQGTTKLEKAEILRLTVDYVKNIQDNGGVKIDEYQQILQYSLKGYKECTNEIRLYANKKCKVDMNPNYIKELVEHLEYKIQQKEYILNAKNSNTMCTQRKVSNTKVENEIKNNIQLSQDQTILQTSSNKSSPTSCIHMNIDNCYEGNPQYSILPNFEINHHNNGHHFSEYPCKSIADDSTDLNSYIKVENTSNINNYSQIPQLLTYNSNYIPNQIINNAHVPAPFGNLSININNIPYSIQHPSFKNDSQSEKNENISSSTVFNAPAHSQYTWGREFVF
ncbi:unnamed protein product [Gordionus sp. m RMFG-2023]|uniref:uncharacterized protein LOC135929999 n=1 Tax=Gordionus sp. m RMFG-2023 TaxID=3053472 RepID=UPI0030E2D087